MDYCSGEYEFPSQLWVTDQVQQQGLYFILLPFYKFLEKKELTGSCIHRSVCGSMFPIILSSQFTFLNFNVAAFNMYYF